MRFGLLQVNSTYVHRDILTDLSAKALAVFNGLLMYPFRQSDVDPSFGSCAALHGRRSFVLCVARIAPLHPGHQMDVTDYREAFGDVNTKLGC